MTIATATAKARWRDPCIDLAEVAAPHCIDVSLDESRRNELTAANSPRMRRRSDRHHLTLVCPDQLPSTFMHETVVPATQQDQVVEIRLAAMDPVDEVMPIAVGGRLFAARPRAVAVANPKRLAQRSRHDS